MECLNHLCGILFGYEIYIHSDHKILVYAAIQSESQIVIHLRIILGEFGTNIQHISGVDNIVDYAIIILAYTTMDQNKPITNRSLSQEN